MSEKLRIQLSKLRTIAISWLLFAFFLAAMDHFSLFSSYSQGAAEGYSFWTNLLFHEAAAVIAIVFGGSFMVFYLNERFRDRPYSHGIIAIVLAYLTVTLFITFFMGLLFIQAGDGVKFGDPEYWAAYRDYLFNAVHVRNILSWSPAVAVTQLLLQMNDKFGHGVFWNLIRGRYHSAKEEERIFMFLDLKSSTQIAEKLGNKKYHQFLRDFYADITNAILYNKGEVYQYVGDEVVITWKMENGIENQHCLKCFFDIRWSIDKKRDKYNDLYGIVPKFKAGLHYGKVVAGEIGIIKRDITYSGDVLNTAARIQSKCNEMGVEILASESLLQLFGDKLNFKTQGMGEISLRGKSQGIQLSAILSN